MTTTELDERLNQLFRGVGWDGREEVKSLINDVVIAITPEKREYGPRDLVEVIHMIQGENYTIDTITANRKALLGGEDE